MYVVHACIYITNASFGTELYPAYIKLCVRFFVAKSTESVRAPKCALSIGVRFFFLESAISIVLSNESDGDDCCHEYALISVCMNARFLSEAEQKEVCNAEAGIPFNDRAELHIALT